MTGRTFLPRTPSKLTNKDMLLLIDEKISVMQNALERTRTDADNLEFAVKIQDIEEELNRLLAKSPEKVAMTRNMRQKCKELIEEKSRIAREIEEKKRVITHYTPMEVHNSLIQQCEQRIVFTTYERDHFITHLNEEKFKLPPQDQKVVENKIESLTKKFETILGDLKKDCEALKATKQLDDIIDYALAKYNRSLEAIHKQYDKALTNLNKRCSELGLEALNVQDIDPKIRRLTIEIERIEEDITKIRTLKDQAIEELERRKLELRQEIEDPETLKCIEQQATSMMEAIEQRHQDIKARKRSVDVLDTALSEMEKNLSRLQHEYDMAMLELQKKKENIRKRMSSIEKLDLQVNILTYKMYEAQHSNRKELDDLLEERNKLLMRTDLTESQIALLLEELDKKIENCKEMNEQLMKSLEAQKKDIEGDTLTKMSMMDQAMAGLRAKHAAMLAELECQKLNATPSQLEIINRKIAELEREFEAEMAELERLQKMGWQNLNSEEKLAALLEVRGLKVTKSGRLLTKSGRILTLEEAECLGLLQGIDVSLTTLKQIQYKDDESSKSSSDVSSVFSLMTSEDVHYLKEVLGKPLALGLAEVLAKKPRDPIHYLGHWLFKYRYNQELTMTQKLEEEALTKERERLMKEKWHQMIQEEARQAVLEMIMRAEEEAFRNELEREMRRLAEQEEEGNMDDEARDVLTNMRTDIQTIS